MSNHMLISDLSGLMLIHYGIYIIVTKSVVWYMIHDLYIFFYIKGSPPLFLRVAQTCKKASFLYMQTTQIA